MTQLQAWAARHGVTAAALDDLRAMLLPPVWTPDEMPAPRSEAAVLVDTRLEASRTGKLAWRNNTGALETPTGGWMRFGLANDTKEMNECVKSSDLIGISPVVITQAHVGSVIGQFWARECKEATWRWPATPSKRELAQLAFLELVVSRGGDGAFTTGPCPPDAVRDKPTWCYDYPTNGS